MRKDLSKSRWLGTRAGGRRSDLVRL